MPATHLPQQGQSMAYKVSITRPAQAELESVIDYVSTQYASKHAVSALVSEYEAALDILEQYPNALPIDFASSRLLEDEIRKAQVGKNYRLFYRVDDARQTVTIISFLHVRRDMQRHVVQDAQISKEQSHE